MVFETYRSRARQTDLFNSGATKLKQIGVHYFRLACDFVKDNNGQSPWKGDFFMQGDLARRHSLIWGADWRTPCSEHSFFDTDHVATLHDRSTGCIIRGRLVPERTIQSIR
jgi:hypothetical protein